MRKLMAIPVAVLGLFLLVRFVVGLIVYPPALLLVMFFPISMLFDFQIALIMEAHLFGVGLCYYALEALLGK